MSQRAKPSSGGVKKSTTRRPAFTVYRDEPEPVVPVLAPALPAASVPAASVFKASTAGRHSPTLFTKKGRESVKALIQAGQTQDLFLPTLPNLNAKRLAVDKKRKTRRVLNPRIIGDELDVDMLDMEGASGSDFSSWGSSRSSSSALSTPPKRRTLVTGMEPSSPGGPPSPDSPTFMTGVAPRLDDGMPSPNMFSSP